MHIFPQQLAFLQVLLFVDKLIEEVLAQLASIGERGDLAVRAPTECAFKRASFFTFAIFLTSRAASNKVHLRWSWSTRSSRFCK